MALGPIDMAGGMPPRAQGGGQLSAELLDARIERLLQILNRSDLTPSQRESTLRALTALQRERTLLQAFAQNEPAAAVGREAQLAASRHAPHVAAPTAQTPTGARVTLGEQGRMLAERANVERALDVSQGADKLFTALGKQTLQADPLRSVLENQVVAATPLVVTTHPVEEELSVASVGNPQPVFGFIPPHWIPGSVRRQARSPASLLLIGIVVLLLVILLIW
ncbi:3-phytase [Edwardsiella tarda]|uniref:3-phytase n=1 Tax=Edwardsiella tarda TaxID=636 RepID=UPI0034DCDC68